MLPARRIGPLTVSAIGLGCMNLSHAYGVPPSPKDSAKLLNRALDLGVTFLDTAALYGGGANERLLGSAVMHRRQEFTLASKCVLDMVEGKRALDGSPEAIGKTLDAALMRLGTDHIDLYYMHRLDRNVPVEESVGALVRAKEAGKIGAIGLSEMSAATIRRAHSVHPIAAVQAEYSPIVRNPEIAVLDTCRELEIGFVAFSPVARGLLAAAVRAADYVAGDIRAAMPRFTQPNLSHNLAAVRAFEALAAELGHTPAQLALAWVLARGEHIVAIPGTRGVAHLEENVAAISIVLDAAVVERVSALFEGGAIRGGRYSAAMQAQIDTEILPGEELIAMPSSPARPHRAPAAGAEECAADLSFDAAQGMLAANVRPLGTERVPLAKAGRRVLAEPVIAQIDAPRRDSSAMDGFAIREDDFTAQARRFRVVGAAYPGAAWAGELSPGEAVRIMTGASMPAGAGRVIVREQIVSDGDDILMQGPPSARTHVRARASDIAVGDTVLPAGRMLEPRALLVAAAADVASVVAWRRPRIHVIASGDELAAPGAASASSDRLPDSLSQALLLMARQWGGIPVGATLARDDPAAIAAAAETAFDDCEVLVLAGGASRGERDFAKQALAPLGLALDFADVAIRPGKPLWYGRVGERHLLGLPGNPTAAMTVARLFLAPLLTALGGRGFAAGLAWAHAPLLAPVAETGPREAFLCGQRREGGVRVIERQAASAQAMLVSADVLVRRPASGRALEAGTLVEILPF